MSMRNLRWMIARAGAACTLCVLGMAATPVQAQELTAQSLIDRQLILDQITRYYYNFGRETRIPETEFYTEDAVLILGTTRREGRAAIAQAYTRPATPPAGGAAPAAATPPATPGAGAAATPPAAARERTPFNVTVDNPLIIVRGNTATSEVVFTEYRTQQVDGRPKLVFTTQGKEFATWVKVNGKWLYKTRQITGDSSPPAGWKE